MKVKTIAATLVLVGTLSACENMQSGSKQSMGAVLGAIGGAIAGAQIGSGDGRLTAVAVGTLAGAVLGSEIGKSLDNADRAIMMRTTQKTLESGQPGRWSNPETGNAGSVTPMRSYRTADGEPCREYNQSVFIAGEEQQAYGTACRDADGTWRIVN